MKLSGIKKIVISLILLLFLVISLNALFTEDISKNNTSSITACFASIDKIYYKGDVSYDLYIWEQNKSFKISADCAGCFAYDNFQYEVKPGQSIKVIIKQDNSFFNILKPTVVSIFTNGRDYLDHDCINQKINNNRIIFPVMFLIGVIILGLIFYEKSLKKKRA